jgi:DNA-directed RNA polymerase subunit H (RpoH/RPB5)
VLTKAQGRLILKQQKVADIERMPRILFSDAVLVRMREDGQDMEVGDIVQIERDDLVSGKLLTWRMIVND